MLWLREQPVEDYAVYVPVTVAIVLHQANYLPSGAQGNP